MSWITDDWRLKLLAVGLAALMLGAVAFSQNPPTTKTLSIPLGYRLAPDIIILDGPSTVNVTFSGLADVIAQIRPDSGTLTAFADATRVAPGTGVKLNVTAQSTIPDVRIPQQPPQIVVNIDQLKTVEIPVSVITHAAPGWTSSGTATCPGYPAGQCKVHFAGPVSWENGITATVNYTTVVNFTTSDSQNWPVVLANSGGPINLAKPTFPQASLDTPTVAVHIQGQQGQTQLAVPLVATVSNPPPPQYELVGITVSPATVVISGDPAVLGRIQRITLSGVDLSGATSTQTVGVTIPYPDNVSGSVATARVTFTIQRNPNVSPSP